MNVTATTHEQAMACLTCSLAGNTPPNFFPQEPGLWERPCPQCGEYTVWVTEPRQKDEPGEDAPMTDERAAELLERFRDGAR